MRFPIADAHCDFLYGMYQAGYDIRMKKPRQTIYLPYLQEGGVKLQFFACWVDRALKTPYLQQCLGMIDAYYRMLEENSGTFVPLHSAYHPDSEKIATVLTVEGGEAIEGSLAALRMLKRLGVAALSLTWNYNNELAGAAVKRNGKGLTELGRETILEMERIGIALDVAHLSDAGIEDALAILKRPIFASHSNARSVYYSQRSLPDVLIKGIAQRGGVVGVNFYHKQLCGREVATVADVVKHILHIVKLGGVRCCAIGSDFDGMTMYPSDLSSSADMQRIAQALLAEGLTEEDVFHICYSNLFSYIVQFV